MKQRVLQVLAACALTSLLPAMTASGQGLTLCDFEDYEIGQEFPLWNFFGGEPASRAVVEADPVRPGNKVLHVIVKEWNTYVPFTLPASLKGPNLAEQKESVSLRLFRSTGDPNDWKKFMICQGSERLYEDEGYPHQGDKGVWQQRSYPLPETSTAEGTLFALGLHSDASDYYIDDIVLKGKYDGFRIAANDTVNISGQNSSSSYVTYATPLMIPTDQQITFLTSRYTYLSSRLVGDGQIHILSGGERTYLGNAEKAYPDGTEFKGEMHVYPYTALSTTNGFYGLVWMHGGKTFNVDAALSDMSNGKANNTLTQAKLVLHDGAVLAAESGTRGMRIGHLEMEAGSQLYGYMKSKDNNNTYYIVGATGSDALLAGRLSPYGGNAKMLLGLIKEGVGTYRLSGHDNLLSGGLRVLRGRVLINGTTAASALYIMKEGVAGGSGTLKGEALVFGILQPGDAGTGTFTQQGRLVLRPTARIDCEIRDTENYDRMIVEGDVTYNTIAQDFSVMDKQPRLRILLADDASLRVGDTFTLLSATGKQSQQDEDWAFDIRYPKAYTWSVEQQYDAEGFRVIARVTSLDYGGQGETGYEDAEDKNDTSSDDGIFDLEAEQQDLTPLRSFVDGRDLWVGTCVPVWTIDVDNDRDARAKLIAEQFNMVVCENEMKFDATEPSQNQFSYYHGDRLVNFAQRHGMYVRGHTLAWHSQVPAWLTADGHKNTKNRSRQELLDILKNHIVNVVGHWKGKVHEWDVANEVLDDNQTTIYSNSRGYDLRPSVWATGIGEDFLDSAFVWAHQVDPDAILILNDYGVEGKGWGKSEALYNLARRLRDSGIPIHGVGLQAHMDANLSYISSIEENVARYQKEDFLCRITELDLGIDSNIDAVLKQQGNAYYQLARIAMRYKNCASLMIWGLSDDLTWRNGKRPLLYDAGLNAKPAYWGVHAALRQADGREILGLEAIQDKADEPRVIETLGSTDGTAIHDLQGRRVEHLLPGRLYIHGGKKIVIR